MWSYYRGALCCGAVPLLSGAAIFLAWWATGWTSLIDAGLLTIVAGLVLFVYGSLLLAGFWIAARRELGLARRLRLSALGGALLLANYPAAGALVLTVLWIGESYSIEVTNADRVQLVNVGISGAGCDESLGTLAPGESASLRLRIRGEGELQFHATQRGAQQTAVIDAYVTGGRSGGRRITVHDQGRIAVEDTSSGRL